jgi:hypothetical protein
MAAHESKKRPFEAELTAEVESLRADIEQFKTASELHFQQAPRPIHYLSENSTKKSEPTAEPKRFRPPEVLDGMASFSLFRAFFISHFRHFGTINGLRLGTLPSVVVPAWEIECAFALLGGLLMGIYGILELKRNDFKIGSSLSVKLENGSFLEISGGFQSSKSIDAFNEAMESLFRICFRIFHEPQMGRVGIMLPNQIDPSDNTIGGHSFLYEKANPENWTLAMKLLLWDLKYIQTRAFHVKMAQLVRGIQR